jgi:hypothetical protein
MSLADALGISGAKALARAAGATPLSVAALDEGVARALSQAGHAAVLTRVENGRIQLDDAVADGLCLSGLPEEAGFLRECARAVKPGGRVLIAIGLATARRERHHLTALMLHAGLVDLEQRWTRGVLLSSGRVRR